MFCEYALMSVPVRSVPHLNEFREMLIDDRRRGILNPQRARAYVQCLEMYNYHLTCDRLSSPQERRRISELGVDVSDFNEISRRFIEAGFSKDFADAFGRQEARLDLDAILAITTTNQTRSLLGNYGVMCNICPYVKRACVEIKVIDKAGTPESEFN